MNIWVDTAIFNLQSTGGISRLWKMLLPELKVALPEATWNLSAVPDLFVSTYYQPAPYGVRSLALVYDLIAERYPLIDRNRADAVALRRAVAEAHSVVSISQTTAGDVKRLLGRDSGVAYPGVAADFGHVAPSDVERFKAAIGNPYVLVVGNRGLYKNVQALYQAWGLSSAAKGCKLLCVGGEDNLPQDAAFASRYPWQHTRLDDHDLALAYAGATALVYPSFMEGFGLPLVEAMTCACPVICDPAMHEIVGEAAIYVDVTKPRDMARALDAVTDYGIRLECATRGVEQAKRYSWQGMAEVMAETLRRAA